MDSEIFERILIEAGVGSEAAVKANALFRVYAAQQECDRELDAANARVSEVFAARRQLQVSCPHPASFRKYGGRHCGLCGYAGLGVGPVGDEA